MYVRQRDKGTNSIQKQTGKCYLSFLPPSLLPIVALNRMEWGSIRAVVRSIDMKDRILTGNWNFLVEMLNGGMKDARQVVWIYLIGG